MSPDEPPPSRIVVTEDEVSAVLAEFGGDARAAVRALLHDLAVLAEGYDRDVSRGFVRRAPPGPAIRRG